MTDTSEINEKSMPVNPNRIYYIDWLRIIAMASIFLYHSNRFFTLSSWHISNAERSLASTFFEETFNLWMMPLFFVLSGAASYYSLKSRKAGSFVKDRFLRIFVPLIGVGIFVLSPLQVYLERLTHDEFSGNFFEFYPHYFDGLYGFGGNFAWTGVHLWYLMDIFFFSIIALPLFIPVGNGGDSILTKLSRKWSRVWVFLFFFLFLGIASLLTDIAGIEWTEKMGSWYILQYFVFFVYGYIIFSNTQIQEMLKRYSPVLVVVAVVLTAAHLVLSFVPSLESMYDTWLFNLRGFCAWSWVLSLIGIGGRLLNSNNRFLSYANEAVLPFYILHQPIILVIGFYVVQSDLIIPIKYLIIAATSFIAILAVYELLVRRLNAFRFLFGMRLRK
ncbi:MAG: acyltransferase family protein [Dehalococcoidales bacterium]|nr:MAG: acyltransferase family protein [Dehalococcoidales bacterium]